MYPFDKKTFYDERNQKVIRPPDKPIELRPSAYGLVVHCGKILFSRCAYTGLLDLPGGGIDVGENIDECIEREGLEETGYHLVRRSREPVAVMERQFYWSVEDRYFMALLHIYPARVLHEPALDWQPADPDEVSEVVLASPEHLLPRDITPCYVGPVSRYMAAMGLPGLF